MSFEHPWMLLGLVAIVLPVLIHLSFRRGARELPFAAINFLLLSDRRLARSFRLRQLLVLILRTLLVAAIPLALAKPYVERPTPLPLVTTLPTSVVVVIDDSGSMNWRPTGEGREAASSPFSRAIEQARGLIDQLPPSHNLAIVSAAQPVRVVFGPLGYDRVAARAALANLLPTHRATDLPGALRLAEKLLAQSELSQQQIVVFSDMTASAWPNLRVRAEGDYELPSPWGGRRRPELHLVDVAEDLLPASRAESGSLPNVGIAEVEVEAGRDPELHVTVRNDSDEEWHDLVTVELGGRALTGFLKVAPGARETKVFRLDMGRATQRQGKVSVPAHGLPLDDERAFVLGDARRVRVLTLNGAPRTVPHEDELFFLERALRPERGLSDEFTVVAMVAEELGSAQIEHTDVVVLANVGALAPEHVEALERFVRDGGGLLVTAGENLRSEESQALGALMPLPARGVKRAGLPLGGEGHTQLAPAGDSPLLSPLGRAGSEPLYRAAFSRYLLLDSAPGGDVEVLLSFADGAPALVHKSLGAGRILLWSSTIDRDWNDLPIQTAYLPLFRRLLRHLAEGRNLGANLTAVLGEPVALALPRQAAALSITSPGGLAVRHELASESGGGRFVLEGLDEPGLYEIAIEQSGPDQIVERRYVAVVPHGAELDLRRLELGPLRLALERTAGDSPRLLAAGASPKPGGGPRTRIWPVVLLSLFGLLLFETWLIVKV